MGGGALDHQMLPVCLEKKKQTQRKKQHRKQVAKEPKEATFHVFIKSDGKESDVEKERIHLKRHFLAKLCWTVHVSADINT